MGVASARLLTACGDSAAKGGGAMAGGAKLAMADVSRQTGSKADGGTVARAISGFTVDLYHQLDSVKGNLVCSPYSVAMALAMTLNGARGRTAAEIDKVLNAGPLPAYDDGFGWLDQELESRAGTRTRLDKTHATVGLDTANSLWGQLDTTWEKPFLTTLAGAYGAGMHLVDYQADSDGARSQINTWTADQTHDRIKEIIPAGVLDAMTRLVLVNAIWFKAPWEETFEKTATAPAPFTRGDGSKVQADLMSHSFDQADYTSGTGWKAARLRYVGRELAMAVVVPDDDLATVEEALAGDGLTDLLASFEPTPGLTVEMPRWTFRTATPLNDPLKSLGMPTAFSDSADFSGMTKDEALMIDQVLHQAFIAVDEDGTEAAAATAVVMRTTSSAGGRALTVRADRAFLFVLHDVATGTPLFIGRVDDPTA
ncbi:MAG: Proteinase inhibitor serpin [Marmoricola sp.]|nr:Proteinase inhibitor serpin [Marmoricola sp.]